MEAEKSVYCNERAGAAAGAGPAAVSQVYLHTLTCPGLIALALLQLGPEGVDVALVDDLGRDAEQLVVRDPGLVALDVLGEVLHALIAPLIRLLHDGADDGAFLDAAERGRIFVEADHLDLDELAGFLQRLIDLRGV